MVAVPEESLRYSRHGGLFKSPVNTQVDARSARLLNKPHGMPSQKAIRRNRATLFADEIAQVRLQTSN